MNSLLEGAMHIHASLKSSNRMSLSLSLRETDIYSAKCVSPIKFYNEKNRNQRVGESFKT